MCGIIGYVGKENALPFIIKGLNLLEYRGYDSSGIAVNTIGGIKVRKKTGRVSLLEKSLDSQPLYGNVAIGHTRWATHGNPCDENAHPFLSYDKNFCIVHNGIITNYTELKEMLLKKGYVFLSDTDSEVIANLLQYCYKSDTEQAILDTLTYLKGSYAFCVISKYSPEKIFAVKFDNPLIIGLSDSSNFVSSDIIGLQNLAEKIIVLKDGQIAIVEHNKVVVKDFFGTIIQHEISDLIKTNYTLDNLYDTFMRKEIDEIPMGIKRTLRKYYQEPLDPSVLRGIKRIFFTGCGTAFHSTLIAKNILRTLSPNLDVYAEIASEFLFANFSFDNSITIAVSQSGETADTLAVIKKVKKRGGKIISICNVPSSTMVHISDSTFFTEAGAEIAVASTKAYNCQVALLSAICVDIANAISSISKDYHKVLKSALLSTARLSKMALTCENTTKDLAKIISNSKYVFYLGRGIDYNVAEEGSLKLKEISYIPCQSIAGGELKHGTLALIEKNVLVVAIATQRSTLEKMYNSLIEIKSRGATTLLITPFFEEKIATLCNYVIKIPNVVSFFSPIISVIPTQFLAYYTAMFRGCDVDKPRNLAKSVTVE